MHEEEKVEVEPSGGNLYRPHPILWKDSGTFWRCKHGLTGFSDNMNWIGCLECEKDDPEAYRAFANPLKSKTV